MKFWKGANPNIDGINYIPICSANQSKMYKDNKRSLNLSLKFSINLFLKRKLIKGIIEVNQFPIIHLMWLIPYLKIKKKKFFLTWHETWDLNYWLNYTGFGGIIGYTIQKFMVFLNSNFVSVSETEIVKLKKIGIKSDHLTKIENGITTFKSINQEKYDKIYDMIYFGRFIEHKNILLLISVIYNLKKEYFKNLRVCIAGDGPQRNEIENKIKKLNLGNTIDLFINPNEEKKYRLLNESKLFVNFSIREGFGITLLEAFSCGVPGIIIEHPNKSMIELAKNYGAAFILPSTGLVKQIYLILSSNDLKNINQKALNFSSLFSWDSLYGKYKLFIKSF